MREAYLSRLPSFLVDKTRTTDNSLLINAAQSITTPNANVHLASSSLQNESNSSSNLDYWVPVGIGILIVILWLGAGFVAALRSCLGSLTNGSNNNSSSSTAKHNHSNSETDERIGNISLMNSRSLSPLSDFHHLSQRHSPPRNLTAMTSAKNVMNCENECCHCLTRHFPQSNQPPIGWCYPVQTNQGLAATTTTHYALNHQHHQHHHHHPLQRQQTFNSAIDKCYQSKRAAIDVNSEKNKWCSLGANEKGIASRCIWPISGMLPECPESSCVPQKNQFDVNNSFMISTSQQQQQQCLSSTDPMQPLPQQPWLYSRAGSIIPSSSSSGGAGSHAFFNEVRMTDFSTLRKNHTLNKINNDQSRNLRDS